MHKTTLSAADHCATGVTSFIRWRADAMHHIDMAIATDEHYALPRLVKAWMLHGAGDATYADKICKLKAETEQCLPSTDCREAKLLCALKLAHAGNGIEAATVLEQMLLESPTDPLLHQLAQEEIFWMGRADWMRDITERAAPAWQETSEHYGSFLSLRAFANEEAGYLDDAERFGRMAVEIDPCDVWGAHAVAHVLIMRGDMQRGIDWLEQLSPNWEHANQMRHHLWWHVCLFLLEVGQHERILQLLTTEVRNPNSPLVTASPAATIDISNVASLLLRLELYGVAVEHHWSALASVCANRVTNHANAFGNIHDMMVLAATGQFDQANELLASMRSRFASQSGSVALAFNAVAVNACEAVLAHRMKAYDRVLELLSSVRHDLHLMGASHAQREVFYHLLVHAAREEGREDLRAVFVGDMERLGFCKVPQRAAYN